MCQNDSSMFWILAKLDRRVRPRVDLELCREVLAALASAGAKIDDGYARTRAVIQNPTTSCVSEVAVADIDQELEGILLSWESMRSGCLIPADEWNCFGELEFAIGEGRLAPIDYFVTNDVSSDREERYLGIKFWGWSPGTLVPTAEESAERSRVIYAFICELIRLLPLHALVVEFGQELQEVPGAATYISDAYARSLGLDLRCLAGVTHLERRGEGVFFCVGAPFWSLFKWRSVADSPRMSVAEYRALEEAAMRPYEVLGASGFGELNLLSEGGAIEIRV